ncbi:MAG: ATP-binding cassette domain-containing protein [Mycobacteriales bacterium]
MIALVVLGSLTTVALTVLVGQVVGAANDVTSGGPVDRFVGLVIALAAVFLIDTTVPVLRAMTMTQLETRMARIAVTQIADPMLAPRRTAHLDDPEVQDAFGRCTTEIQIPIDLGPTFAAFQLGSRITLLGSLVITTVFFHWWVAAAVLLTTVFLEWWWRRYILGEMTVWRGRTEGQRRATYVFDLAVLRGAKEIRIFGLGGWLLRSQQVWLADALKPITRRRVRAAGANLVVMLLPIAVVGLAVVLAGHEAWQGRLSITAVATVIPALLAAGQGFDAGSSSQVRRAQVALREMRGLPRLIEERYPDPAGRSVDFSRAPQHEVRFDRVGFRYPGSDIEVLRGLDLAIDAHEALGIVGVNGAGKSTLVKLLAGAYAPTSGRILVDGVDLATVDAESLGTWQRRIATIVQDFLRLPLSARDNVSLGVGPPPADGYDASDRSAADLAADTQAAERAGGDLGDRASPGRMGYPAGQVILRRRRPLRRRVAAARSRPRAPGGRCGSLRARARRTGGGTRRTLRGAARRSLPRSHRRDRLADHLAPVLGRPRRAPDLRARRRPDPRVGDARRADRRQRALRHDVPAAGQPLRRRRGRRSRRG